MATNATIASLPSQEKNNPWVYAESQDVKLVREQYLQNRSDEDESSIGKWMIFNNCNKKMPNQKISYHDHAWQCIKKLVECNPSSKTGIHSAKASTSWSEYYEAKPNNTNGVICCYTINYADKNLAKRAADAIRNAYYYPKDIFYKRDEDTYANKYRHLGSKCVTIYKHNTGKQLFERDSGNPKLWTSVV